MKLNVKKSMTRGIQHELSDADYKPGAQAKIAFGVVDSVGQMHKNVICLDGTDREASRDSYIESTACNHGESIRRASRGGTDREVRIKSVDTAEE